MNISGIVLLGMLTQSIVACDTLYPTLHMYPNERSNAFSYITMINRMCRELELFYQKTIKYMYSNQSWENIMQIDVYIFYVAYKYKCVHHVKWTLEFKAVVVVILPVTRFIFSTKITLEETPRILN